MSKKINECPADDALEASFVEKALGDHTIEEVDSNLLSTRLSQYLGMLRAMHLWFHGAHNVTRGAGFGGDHVDLFGRIYLKIQDEIDGAIEKAVGVTGATRVLLVQCTLQILLCKPWETIRLRRQFRLWQWHLLV